MKYENVLRKSIFCGSFCPSKCKIISPRLQMCSPYGWICEKVCTPGVGCILQASTDGWVFEKACTYDRCFQGHPSTYHGYLLEILPPLGVKWLDYRISLQNYPIFANYGLVSRKFCNYDGCFLHESPRMALMYCGPHMLSKFPSEYPPHQNDTLFKDTYF